MTREEISKARRDETWLVDTSDSYNILVMAFNPWGVGAWWVGKSGGAQYGAFERHLRLATAKELLELGDD